MSSARVDRVKRQLLREASVILKEDLKDPRIGFVTLINAELSPDLRHAKIFVSIMGDSKEQEATFQVLSHAAGFIRSRIGQRIRLRYTPEIVFVMDKTIQETDRLFRIMDEIKSRSRQDN